jgi:hypothetical protein
MADGREDALDRALDEFWDRLVADGTDTPPDRSLPRDVAATVRRVHAADGAPAPSRAFVRRLREDLMERSVSAAPLRDA